MGIELLNVVLPSRHFKQSVLFYRDTLGLDVLHAGEEYCFFRAGGANIAIHPVKDGNEFSPTGAGFYLDLCVDDLSEIRQRLDAQEIAVRKAWTDTENTFLLVADPDGNLLELMAPVKGSQPRS